MQTDQHEQKEHSATSTTDVAMNSTKPNTISLLEQLYLTKSKISKLVYSVKEYNTIQNFINFANDTTEYEWTCIDTNESDFKMEYVEPSKNVSGMCIARGQCLIDCNAEDLFFGFEDYARAKDLDENCLSITLKHKYDEHRRIVSGSFSAPSPVWNREFLYKEIRALLDDKGTMIRHSESDKEIIDLRTEYMKMKGRGCVCFGYSVDSNDVPFDDVVAKKHVRGDLKFGGYQFINIGDGQCKATYLVCMDLKGWIPNWVNNKILPQQSRNILKMKQHVETMRKRMQNTMVDLVDEAKED